MNQLPELTDEQRRANLAKAMDARRASAELAAQMRSGRLPLSEALEDGRAKRMRVERFLKNIPGVGEAKAARIMREIGAAPSRRVGGLGPRQRERLLSMAENGFN